MREPQMTAAQTRARVSLMGVEVGRLAIDADGRARLGYDPAALGQDLERAGPEADGREVTVVETGDLGGRGDAGAV